MIKVKLTCAEKITQFKDNYGRLWKIGDRINDEIIENFFIFGSPELDNWFISIGVNSAAIKKGREKSIGKPVITYTDDGGWDFLNIEDDSV